MKKGILKVNLNNKNKKIILFIYKHIKSLLPYNYNINYMYN